MKSMYKQRKKRAVDPNAPPRPTLLGHEKEMKGYRTQFDQLAQHDTDQAIEIAALKRKVARLQSQVDAMVSIIRRKM